MSDCCEAMARRLRAALPPRHMSLSELVESPGAMDLAAEKIAAQRQRPFLVTYKHQALDNTSPDAIGLAREGRTPRYVRENPAGDSFPLRNKLRERIVDSNYSGNYRSLIDEPGLDVRYNPKTKRYVLYADTGVRDVAGRESGSVLGIDRRHRVSKEELKRVARHFDRDIKDEFLEKGLKAINRHRFQRAALGYGGAALAAAATLAGGAYALRKKTADLKPGVKLQPHQADAVQRAGSGPGMILNWGLGSGKTLGAIAVAEKRGGKVLIVTPASLRTNFREQLKKFVTAGRVADYTIISYEEFRRDPEGWVSRIRPNVIVADEFHRLRNPNPREPFEKVRGRVPFMVGLTGSIVNNEPDEVVPLVNLIADKKVYTQDQFKARHFDERRVGPGILGTLMGVKPGVARDVKGQGELRKNLGPYIHRFTGTPEYRKHLPRVQEEVVEVQMTPRQEQTYKGIATRNPILAYKIRNNLPPSKRELKDMNAFMSAMRQISNNPTSFDGSMSDAPNEAVVAQSPKFKAMVDDIQSRSKKDPNYRAVIYSNFLSSGVKPVVEELKNRHVPAETFTGELNDKLRQQIVDNLNRGRVKVLGLSPAGGEGLDLKGVRQVHLTEDHWNPERTAQAVGRSARYKSHEHLPEDQRRVDVKRYVAVHPDRWYHRLPLVNKPLSADQWIMSRRQEKQELNQRFLRALPEYSG